MEARRMAARLESVTLELEAHYRASVHAGLPEETPAEAAHFGKLRAEQVRLTLALGNTLHVRQASTLR